MRNLDLRRYGPVIVILVLVAAPLAIWAATSGGSDEDQQGLIAERSVGLTGEPELVLSIAGEARVTNGASSVRVECRDREGKVIVKGTQPWPFVEEAGYPYPHVHQADTPEKVEGARRCRVLGTDTRLEAEVQ
ncbi:MAG: hypothetical protein ACRDLQ_08320 [Solirubrobacterales bacterium]